MMIIYSTHNVSARFPNKRQTTGGQQGPFYRPSRHKAVPSPFFFFAMSSHITRRPALLHEIKDGTKLWLVTRALPELWHVKWSDLLQIVEKSCFCFLTTDIPNMIFFAWSITLCMVSC